MSKCNCTNNKEGADISRSLSSYVSHVIIALQENDADIDTNHETLSLTASSFLEQWCRAELWKCKINIFFRCLHFPKNQWLPNTSGFVAFRRESFVLLTPQKVYFESKSVASAWSFYSSRIFRRHEHQTWRLRVCVRMHVDRVKHGSAAMHMDNIQAAHTFPCTFTALHRVQLRQWLFSKSANFPPSPWLCKAPSDAGWIPGLAEHHLAQIGPQVTKQWWMEVHFNLSACISVHI